MYSPDLRILDMGQFLNPFTGHISLRIYGLTIKYIDIKLRQFFPILCYYIGMDKFDLIAHGMHGRLSFA